MRMKVRSTVMALMLLVGAVGLSSCEKQAGEGGNSIIKGKIWVENYNGAGNLVSSYYGPEERVYIVYGDNTIHDDDTRTGPDGQYKFVGLQPGKYRVFAYSDCATCDSGTEAVYAGDIEITDRAQEVEVQDITVRR